MHIFFHSFSKAHLHCEHEYSLNLNYKSIELCSNIHLYKHFEKRLHYEHEYLIHQNYKAIEQPPISLVYKQFEMKQNDNYHGYLQLRYS
jgi:hypothetical protein